MLQNNFFLYSLKIISDLFRDILMFPLWWYSRGLIDRVKAIWQFLQNREQGLGLSVWLKNIFTPMYGQRDWQGVLISIFIRIVQIIFRSILMLINLVLGIGALLLWLVLPLFIVYEIIFQLL